MNNKPVKLSTPDFRKQLEQFIQFRGIDIVLHLKDGSMLELDKNRQMEGDIILKKDREHVLASVRLDEVIKADFYAA